MLEDDIAVIEEYDACAYTWEPIAFIGASRAGGEIKHDIGGKLRIRYKENDDNEKNEIVHAQGSFHTKAIGETPVYWKEIQESVGNDYNLFGMNIAITSCRITLSPVENELNIDFVLTQKIKNRETIIQWGVELERFGRVSINCKGNDNG